jgi:hypothetical protein
MKANNGVIQFLLTYEERKGNFHYLQPFLCESPAYTGLPIIPSEKQKNVLIMFRLHWKGVYSLTAVLYYNTHFSATARTFRFRTSSYCELYSICDVYTGCPGRNVKNFGRLFLMLNYTDITQKTYIQSWMVTKIMAREVWNFDICYSLIDYQIHIETGRNMWFL